MVSSGAREHSSAGRQRRLRFAAIRMQRCSCKMRAGQVCAACTPPGHHSCSAQSPRAHLCAFCSHGRAATGQFKPPGVAALQQLRNIQNLPPF